MDFNNQYKSGQNINRSASTMSTTKKTKAKRNKYNQVFEFI